MNEVTQLLKAIEQGDNQAADELLPLVYEELRRLANLKLAQEPPGQTLQATALVHEAYLRLVMNGQAESATREIHWQGRGHFFSAAAEAMRRILIDNARRKQRLKHGGSFNRHDVTALEVPAPEPDWNLLVLDAALDKLETKDKVKADLVKLRFFAGLTMSQAAESLGISNATADRYWSYARAWLYRQISKDRA